MPEPIDPADLDRMKDAAEKAVHRIVDPEMKRFARDAILGRAIAFQALQDPRAKYFSQGFNVTIIVSSSILAILGCLSLWLRWPAVLSGLVAAGIDIVVGVLIVLVGLRSDGRATKLYDRLVPQRIPALIAGALFFVGIMHAFANMYLADHGVSGGGNACCARIAPKQYLETRIDALYFSCVTMTTLGYGDYTADTRPARVLVIWQLTTSVLVLIFFFPLLISRIAAF
jgi:voltage-gated potassium channel Kch